MKAGYVLIVVVVFMTFAWHRLLTETERAALRHGWPDAGPVLDPERLT